MKNIKLRIVYLILCSALLLFALFMLAVNLIIPAHFVREAKKALISEAQYQNRTIPYTDDESFFDDEWNDAEEHFLTPSIVFLELDNANQSSGWNRDAYRLEKKLLEYCKGRELSLEPMLYLQNGQASPDFHVRAGGAGRLGKAVRLYHVHRHRAHHPLYRDAELGVLWGAAGDLLRHVPAGVPVRSGILRRRRSGSRPSSRMPPTS